MLALFPSSFDSLVVLLVLSFFLSFFLSLFLSSSGSGLEHFFILASEARTEVYTTKSNMLFLF